MAPKSASLTCPYCGATGFAIWDDSFDVARGARARRRLVNLHGPFHEEKGRTAAGGPLIVCDKCDQIQPD